MNYIEKFKDEESLSSFITSRLRELREANKFTQAQVSYFMNISEQSYSRTERGRYKASIFFIMSFCSVFNISLTDFFNFDKDTDTYAKFHDFFIQNKNNVNQFCQLMQDFYDQ